MSMDSLTSVLTEERSPQSSFLSTLPLRCMELSHSILSSSSSSSSSVEQEQPISVLLDHHPVVVLLPNVVESE